MAAWAMVDGRLSPLADAVVPVADPGLTLGWTVFETLEAFEGQPVRWEAHEARLRASAASMRIPWPASACLREEVERLAGTVGGQVRVRITLTRGGVRILTAEPGDGTRRHRPVTAATRIAPSDPFVGGRPKHGSRAPWAVALLDSGVDEVLMVSPDGYWREGTTSAIVVERDDALWSVDDSADVLASTTIDALIERAVSRHIPWHRAPLRAEEGFTALYIASATRDLAPVVALDGRVLTGWGPLGRLLATGGRE
jgi:branched-chain amino acid aminotransferase